MGHPLIAAFDDEKEILDNYVEFLGDSFKVLCFQTPEAFIKELPQFHQDLKLLPASMTFEKLLDFLEAQLKWLLKTEINLAELKFNHWRLEVES